MTAIASISPIHTRKKRLLFVSITHLRQTSFNGATTLPDRRWNETLRERRGRLSRLVESEAIPAPYRKVLESRLFTLTTTKEATYAPLDRIFTVGKFLLGMLILCKRGKGTGN